MIITYKYQLVIHYYNGSVHYKAIHKGDVVRLDDLDTSEIKYIKIINNTSVLCPECSSKMTVRDTKSRKVKTISGESICFKATRYRCKKCNRLHTEFPDFIEPYKQYESALTTAIQTGNTEVFSGDEGTIRYRKGLK